MFFLGVYTVASKNGTANGTTNRLANVEERQGVSIPAPLIYRLQLPIRGISPLLMCRFDEKVKEEMEAKGSGKARNKKVLQKDPEAEFNAARWISTEGWDGIHAGGFRAALISAARSVDGLTMTALKQAIFIIANGYAADGTPLVRINKPAGITSPWPQLDTRMCRTTTGVPYPRHRPLYWPWGALLTLEVSGAILTESSAANLVAIAGRFCGVGEWRPTSKQSFTGDFGRWEIATD